MKKENLAMLIEDLELTNKYLEDKLDKLIKNQENSSTSKTYAAEDYMFYRGMIRANNKILDKIQEIEDKEKVEELVILKMERNRRVIEKLNKTVEALDILLNN